MVQVALCVFPWQKLPMDFLIAKCGNLRRRHRRAGAVRRGVRGGEGKENNLGRGHTNTRQSPNILNQNQTYSTKVVAKTD